MSEGLPASREHRRRAKLSAEGGMDEPDMRWRKSLTDAELMPKYEFGYVIRAVVRDQSSGVIIEDSGRSNHTDSGRLS